MTIFERFVFWLRHSNCEHRFDYKDLKARETPNGYVTWACWKCGRVFSAPSGLDIIREGSVESKPVHAQPPPSTQP